MPQRGKQTCKKKTSLQPLVRKLDSGSIPFYTQTDSSAPGSAVLSPSSAVAPSRVLHRQVVASKWNPKGLGVWWIAIFILGDKTQWLDDV